MVSTKRIEVTNKGRKTTKWFKGLKIQIYSYIVGKFDADRGHWLVKHVWVILSFCPFTFVLSGGPLKFASFLWHFVQCNSLFLANVILRIIKVSRIFKDFYSSLTRPSEWPMESPSSVSLSVSNTFLRIGSLFFSDFLQVVRVQ